MLEFIPTDMISRFQVLYLFLRQLLLTAELRRRIRIFVVDRGLKRYYALFTLFVLVNRVL